MADNSEKGAESAIQAKKSNKKSNKKDEKDDEDCDCGVSIGKNNGVKYILLTFLILGVLAAVVVPILIVTNKNDKPSPS